MSYAKDRARAWINADHSFRLKVGYRPEAVDSLAAEFDRVRLEGYNEAVAVMLKERERWAMLERNLRNLRNEPAGALDQESRFDPRPGLDASVDVAERKKLGLDHGISILTRALAARSPATPGEKP